MPAVISKSVAVDSVAGSPTSDGTIFGATFRDGKLNEALHFSGSVADYVTLPSTVLNGLGTFTFEFWATFERGNQAGVVSAANSGENNELLIFPYPNSDRVDVYFQGIATAWPSAGLTIGKWHHIAVVANATANTVSVYVDGSLLSQKSITFSALTVDAGGLILGQDQDSVGGTFNAAQAHQGLLDDLRIWNDERTPAEISDNMNAELTGSESGLVGYWKFNLSKSQLFTHPRIGHQDIVRTGTLTASTENADNVAANVADGLTWDYWQPLGMPAWLQVDAGAASVVDYCGLAAHTLGTENCGVKVQFADSASPTGWVDATAEYFPTDDAPIVFLFEPTTQQLWRILISQSGSPVNNPQIGVCYIGQALAMPQMLYVGHNPMSLSRDTELRPNRSENGQWLGRSIVRQGNATSAAFTHLTAAWYRANFDPFVVAARTRGFFWAWRPGGYPDDAGFGWTDRDIVPQNTGPGDMMSVTFDIDGVAGD